MSHRNLANNIQGPVFSIITPFKSNEDINYKVLENYIDYIYENGASIFYVMGYNSRFSQLNNEEIKNLNKFVTTKVKSLNKNNIVIVADPLHCTTRVSIDFCNHAYECGADIISLIVREKFFSIDQIVSHYEMCSNNSDIGILIHEMPFLSGLNGKNMNWPIKLIDELCDIKNIVAIKEDAKDDVYTKEVIETINDRIAIIVSGGGKEQFMKSREYGCKAWLNGLGVFMPKIASNFWLAIKNNDLKYCNSLIEEVERPFFENCVKKYGWHLTIKVVLNYYDIMPVYERMPMKPLNSKQIFDIEHNLEKIPFKKYLNN